MSEKTLAALIKHAQTLIADKKVSAVGWRWARNLLAANPKPKVQA